MIGTHSLILGCERPSNWVTHSGNTYEFKDCDADGIADHVFSDLKGGYGVIQSSNNCANNWPNGKCASEGK